MKILDRYIAKNFLFGYAVALCILMGMFITIDLFVNLDEFAEYSDAGLGFVAGNILRYYSIHALLWYRDLAAMVIVVAAVFSLARMTRNNELIAVMASGVSLKRILAPILVLSLLLTALMVVDQEWVVPNFSQELMRTHDELELSQTYDVWYMSDEKGSLFCSNRYDESLQTFKKLVIVLRDKVPGREEVYRVVGRIQTETAVYDAVKGGWALTGGVKEILPDVSGREIEIRPPQPVDFYASQLKPDDIPIRRREGFMSILSLQQLTELEHHAGARKTDLAELALQKHSRITSPIINLIMLMVALPVLICRDPRAMKTAILISFVTTSSCFLLVFVCRLFATEVIFGQVRPALWSWAPIFVFFPIAVIEIDSMRT